MPTPFDITDLQLAVATATAKPSRRYFSLTAIQGEQLLASITARMFKVQTATANGWADLKSSEDDGPYVTDLFDDHSSAQAEVNDLTESFPDTSYRAVPANTPAQDDLYT